MQSVSTSPYRPPNPQPPVGIALLVANTHCTPASARLPSRETLAAAVGAFTVADMGTFIYDGRDNVRRPRRVII